MGKPVPCAVSTQPTYEAAQGRLIVPGIDGARSRRDADEITAWHLGGYAPAGRAQRGPGAGLVRLETSDTGPVDGRRPTCEELRIADGRRRFLRLFKSLSCAGDLHRVSVDEKGRLLKGWFVTLTYKPSVDWEPGQITGLMMRMRVWAYRRGCKLRFVWVAEQHKSGRIHYHAIVFLPSRVRLPFPDKQGWWPHGMSQRQELRKQSVGYLMKYASKCKEPVRPWPKGCRLHGNGGLNKCERIRRAWWVLPKYQRERCEDWHRVTRRCGGGWIARETGEVWPSWGWDELKPECVGPPAPWRLLSPLKRQWWVGFKALSGQECMQ